MKFYHFTSSLRMTSILVEGIKYGDVATAPQEGFNAPWLTRDGKWENQTWATSTVSDRTEVRITVELDPETDENVLHWLTLAKELGVPDYWMVAFHTNTDPTHWWLYYGVITPDKITQVELKPGAETRPGLAEAYSNHDLVSLRRGDQVVDRADTPALSLAPFQGRFGSAKTR